MKLKNWILKSNQILDNNYWEQVLEEITIIMRINSQLLIFLLIIFAFSINYGMNAFINSTIYWSLYHILRTVFAIECYVCNTYKNEKCKTILKSNDDQNQNFNSLLKDCDQVLTERINDYKNLSNHQNDKSISRKTLIAIKLLNN